MTPPHDALPHEQRRARRPPTQAKLTRSRTDRRLAGVLGGVAAFIGASPTAVRLLFCAATLLSGGILAIGYLLLWWLIPQQSR